MQLHTSLYLGGTGKLERCTQHPAQLPYTRVVQANAQQHDANRREIIKGTSAAIFSALQLNLQPAFAQYDRSKDRDFSIDLDRLQEKPVKACGVLKNSKEPDWVEKLITKNQQIRYRGGQVACRINNDIIKDTLLSGKQRAKRPAVLVVGGGPSGAWSSEYLTPYFGMGEVDRRPVVLYDQAGTGRSLFYSGAPPPQESIDMGLYTDEMLQVISQLDLDQFHIVGVGFGGMVALTALPSIRSRKVLSLILASTPPSYADLIADRISNLKQQFSEEQSEILLSEDGLERSKHSREYNIQMKLYQQTYLNSTAARCTFQAANQGGTTVSKALTDNKYFEARGSLAAWQPDSAALAQQTLPVAYIRGQNDEVSVLSRDAVLNLFPNSKEKQTETYNLSGSFTHIDAYEDSIGFINKWLIQHDVTVTAPIRGER